MTNVPPRNRRTNVRLLPPSAINHFIPSLTDALHYSRINLTNKKWVTTSHWMTSISCLFPAGPKTKSLQHRNGGNFAREHSHAGSASGGKRNVSSLTTLAFVTLVRSVEQIVSVRTSRRTRLLRAATSIWWSVSVRLKLWYSICSKLRRTRDGHRRVLFRQKIEDREGKVAMTNKYDLLLSLLYPPNPTFVVRA